MNKIILLATFLVIMMSGSVVAQLVSGPVAKTVDMDFDYMIDGIELGDKIIFSTYSKRQRAHIVVAYDTVDNSFICLHNSGERMVAQPDLTKVGERVFFRTYQNDDYRLYYTDGTANGTKEFIYPEGEIVLNSLSRMIEIHNRLYVEMKVGEFADRIYSIDENLNFKAINEFDWLGMGDMLDTIHLSNGRIAVWGDDIWIPLTINASHQFSPIFDTSFENENTIGSTGDTVVYSNYKRFYFQKRNSTKGTRINFDPQILSEYERHLTKIHTHIYKGHMYCLYPEGGEFKIKKVNILTGENEDLFSTASHHEGYLETYGTFHEGIIYFTMPEGTDLFSMYSFNVETEEIIKLPFQMKEGNVHQFKTYVAYVGLDDNFYGFNTVTNQTFYIAQRKILQEEEYPIIPRKDRIEAGGRYFFNFDVHLRVSALWELEENSDELGVEITAQGRDICGSGSTAWLFPVVSGNSGPYTFQWSGGTPGGFSYEYVTVTGSGNYTVTVTDQLGNTSSGTLAYSNSNPKITVSQNIKAAGGGTPSGEIEIKVTNGPGNPYSYYWYHDTSSDSIATGLLPGPYTFEVLGKNYCKVKKTVTVPLGTSTSEVEDISSGLYPTLLSTGNRMIYLDKLDFIPSEVVLIDNSGRILKNWKSADIVSKLELPHNLSSGRYHLQLTYSNRLYSAKLTVVD